MCCWFGWHFHDSLSYNRVVLSVELLEWGLTHFHDLENYFTYSKDLQTGGSKLE